jgi:hypothetical protein
MATTYSLISSVTVGSGGAASIDFTSIPGTYTDLLVKLSTRTNRVDVYSSVFISFNGSTANFSTRYIQGDGSSAISATGTDFIFQGVGSTATANTFSNAEIYIPNYTSSNNKSFSVDGVAETNGTTQYMNLTAGLWSQTAAITSIAFTGMTFSQYTTAYLYGISNA